MVEFCFWCSQQTRFCCSSNLSSQVFVHEEDEGSGDSLPLAPRGTRTVRVCVAPNLEVEELKDGMCKSLVGGLHFVLTEHAEGNSPVRCSLDTFPKISSDLLQADLGVCERFPLST